MKKTFIALALAAALPAFAQSAAANAGANANITGPDNKSTQKAGEAYPNDKTAGMDKGKPETVKKVEKSRPVQATKNVAEKTGDAVSDTAKKGANATRNVGNDIAKKLPQTQNNTSVSGNAGAKVEVEKK
jgi:hypothetical protein